MQIEEYKSKLVTDLVESLVEIIAEEDSSKLPFTVVVPFLSNGNLCEATLSIKIISG